MLRKDPLDPLPYTAELPSLMSASGRVDAHSVIAHYLADNRLAGAYLEFGVGRGRSAVSAIRAYGRASVCGSFHLFDSFSGLPRLEGIDLESGQFQEGNFAFTQTQVRDFLVEHDAWDAELVNLHAGWFDDTLPRWVKQATRDALLPVVIHMDMDLYSSCTSVLNAITPLLRSGTVMIFDDWNCFAASNQHGERRAVIDWLSRNKTINLNAWFPYGWHGQVFFCDIATTEVPTDMSANANQDNMEISRRLLP